MWLIVGLGNPGVQYAQHRHNVGFMVVDEMRACHQAERPSSMLGGELASLSFSGEKLLTLKPMEYMNVSGYAVQRVLQFYKLSLQRMIVVHDDLDLPFAQLQVKQGGGHGGNNGLRSIIGMVGSDFLRVRVGIGRPPAGHKEQPADYVLTAFSKDQKVLLPSLIERTVDCVLSIVVRGVPFAMNQYNRR